MMTIERLMLNLIFGRFLADPITCDHQLRLKFLFTTGNMRVDDKKAFVLLHKTWCSEPRDGVEQKLR